MRILILSESIYDRQSSSESPYTPTDNIHLDVGKLDTSEFIYSVFDYDVSIIHIHNPEVGWKK